MQKEVLYTVEEVATQLRVHPETVRNWIKTGQLAAINLGGSAGYRISESDLADFLRKRRGAPKQDE
jgi:excisionase family DNA binding protein